MNTAITLSPELTALAVREAAERGMSLPDLVRTVLENVVSTSPSDDPFFADTSTFADEGPSNVSLDHDEFLYGDAS